MHIIQLRIRLRLATTAGRRDVLAWYATQRGARSARWCLVYRVSRRDAWFQSKFQVISSDRCCATIIKSTSINYSELKRRVSAFGVYGYRLLQRRNYFILLKVEKNVFIKACRFSPNMVIKENFLIPERGIKSENTMSSLGN